MSKIKILCLSSDGPDATTSLLRTHGPFNNKNMRDICEITECPVDQRMVSSWSSYWPFDLLYMHRPHTPFHTYIFEMAKMNGLPVWVDQDDDLFNICDDNPCFELFAARQVRKSMEILHRNADILTVSSPVYQKWLKEKLNLDSILIRNGFPDQLMSLKKPHKKQNKVAWRGSTSHQVDLLAFQEPIVKILKKNFNFTYNFMGINPYYITRQVDGLKFNLFKVMNMNPFYQTLTNENADYMFVPLVDTQFNRVKSNLSWFDGTLAGSVVLGPNFEEWNDPGQVTYNNPMEFEGKFQEMLNLSEAEGIKRNNDSWNCILDCYLTSKLNNKRIEILKNL